MKLCCQHHFCSLHFVNRKPWKQVTGGYSSRGGEGPAHVDDELVRLVLAEELQGVSNTLLRQDRLEWMLGMIIELP